VIGIAMERRIPTFAPQTFREWFAQRRRPNENGRPKVILWPDTWNNHFHPTTAQAAVAVLEDAGFAVHLPRVPLCCGRPLYDIGMLPLAKRMLREILDALRDDIRAGVCVVGLEPSCVSVFRDEMGDLLGPDNDAKLLREQTFLLSEFLATKVPGYKPPPLQRKVLLHEHCHHKAVLDRTAEMRLFAAMGLDVEAPDTGCCGMAGAFGFERAHYDVSMTVGERVLLPAVRAADPTTIVVADGFSCREQVAQTTDRQALHPAQVIKMALDDRETPRTDRFPERRYMPDPRREAADASMQGAIGIGVVFLAAFAVLAVFMKGRRDG
jgi:Fe-S oxidoreductase